MKDVVVIGGPNGAGKTTAASQLLPTELELNEFLNADEIARGLSPFDPDSKAVAAGRIMIERIADIIAAAFLRRAQAGETFAIMSRSRLSHNVHVSLVALSRIRGGARCQACGGRRPPDSR